VRMEKKQGELVPKNQSKRLQELAQEMGASTRAIGCHPDGTPFGYDASIAGLIDNINQAIQTATSIKNSEYTRRSVYITIVAVAVSMLALVASIYFSAQNVSVAQEANKFTRDSLELQRNEFKLRNRPYITDRNWKFAKEMQDLLSGKVYSRSVELELVNVSEFPANELRGSFKAMLNDKVIYMLTLNPLALANSGVSKINVPLTEEQYLAIENGDSKFKLIFELTYRGILTKEAEEYETSGTCYYSAPEKRFKYENVNYR